jgi:hypothetical protein
MLHCKQNSFNVGIRLSPQYYGSSYHVNNNIFSRRPAPGYNLRYVWRYNDDLLVNVCTGRVVNIYHNFYW